jgi:hypothetical protein
MVEAVTHSRYWSSTLMIVLEDDAQDGPDHFDSHRSPLLVISPYGRSGVVHRFANTTDVIATIDHVLHMGALSKYDALGRPLAGVFADKADTTEYHAIEPTVSRFEINSDSTTAARLSRKLDLSAVARTSALFNRILWRVIKVPTTVPERNAQPHSERAGTPRPGGRRLLSPGEHHVRRGLLYANSVRSNPIDGNSGPRWVLARAEKDGEILGIVDRSPWDTA